MMQILPTVNQMWDKDRAKLLGNAAEITNFLKRRDARNPAGDVLSTPVLQTAYRQLSARYDSQRPRPARVTPY